MRIENVISDTPPTQIEFAERLETAGLIHEMIKTLPVKEKLVLRMHYFEHMSFKEIGRYFSLTYGTIYLRHKRALRMLRHPERINRLKESYPKNIFYTPDV
jgi:RNA polymerase sigma factor (sigma-70 family)